MTDVIILDYLVNDTEHFSSVYKTNLLPVVRAARGFRHIQLVRGRDDHVLILIEWNEVADWTRCKKTAPPQTFPPDQDLISEQAYWTLPNTSFPLANARQYKPRPLGPRAQANRREPRPPRIRHQVRPRWACSKCHEQPYIFIDTTQAPDYAAYQECRCGRHRMDDLITIRWATFGRDAADHDGPSPPTS